MQYSQVGFDNWIVKLVDFYTKVAFKMLISYRFPLSFNSEW